MSLSAYASLAHLLSGIMQGVSNYQINRANQQQALSDRNYNSAASQFSRLVSLGINPNSAIGQISNTYSMPSVTSTGATVGADIASGLSNAISDAYSRKRQREIDYFNSKMREKELQLKEQELLERKQNYEMNRLLMGEKFLAQSFANSFNNATFTQKMKQTIYDTLIKGEIFGYKFNQNQFYLPYYSGLLDNLNARTDKTRADINLGYMSHSLKKQDFQFKKDSFYQNLLDKRVQNAISNNFKKQTIEMARERIRIAIEKGDYRKAQYWVDFLTGILSSAGNAAAQRFLGPSKLNSAGW